jgi:hypothetical protein
MFWKKKEPKSRFSAGQDVMDSQDAPLGHVVAVHERYLEIDIDGKRHYVPVESISPIPRGSGIALTIARAQLSVKNWQQPPQ